MAYVKTNKEAGNLTLLNGVLMLHVQYNLVENSTDPVTVVGAGGEPIPVTTATAEEIAAYESIITKGLALLS